MTGEVLAAAPAPGALLHLAWEAAAYAAGFALYRRERARRGDVVDDGARWTVIAAAVLGAAAGSKLLHHLAAPSELARKLGEPALLLGGKSLVGALLGGWLAVELAKRAAGIRRRTGDLFALPLCAGIALGRVGCLLAGPVDGTHGRPWDGPLALAFGDGVPRHPVLLYELVFLAALAAGLARARGRWREGALFRAFLAAYLAFRLAVDGLKPWERVGALNGVQWASLVGLAALAAGELGARSERAAEEAAT